MIQRVREEQKKAILRLIDALKGMTPQQEEEEGGTKEQRVSGESTTYTYGQTYSSSR